MGSSSDSETLEISFCSSDFEDAQFCCELTAENPVYTFAVDKDEDEVFSTQLELGFASIRHDVKDEYNVVEVITCDYDGDEITKTLAILERSGDCIASLHNLLLDPPVTFRLRAGSGPVEIVAAIIKEQRDELY